MYSKPKTDTAIEWRILGQERDGSLLASWVSLSSDVDDNGPALPGRTNIGIYAAAQKSFNVLYTFAGRENVIQASVNASQTLLAFVLKDTSAGSPKDDDANPPPMVYKPFVVEVIKAAPDIKPHSLLDMPRSKQVMVQFLWRKPATFEKLYQDKFLLFIHEECKL